MSRKMNKEQKAEKERLCVYRDSNLFYRTMGEGIGWVVAIAAVLIITGGCVALLEYMFGY